MVGQARPTETCIRMVDIGTPLAEALCCIASCGAAQVLSKLADDSLRSMMDVASGSGMVVEFQKLRVMRTEL